MTAEEFIQHLADVAEAVGIQAGVGGMETAGGIISYLAEHPESFQAFIAGGFLALPVDLRRSGRLTWHGADGRVFTPQQARLAAQVITMRPKNEVAK
jgi:hypothetical protein